MHESTKWSATLAGFFLLFLVFRPTIPDPVAGMVASGLGTVFILFIALGLTASQPIYVSALAWLVAYTLIQRTPLQTGDSSLAPYYPTEQQKWSPYTAMNQFPYTLEQEVVADMASRRFNQSYVKTPWKPVNADTYGAVRIDQM